ncbi:MAG: GNAT family N-acetyltransferase [Nitrospiria bacterium]
MYSIRVVRTIEEFQSLGEEWGLLLKEAAPDNIFLSWEWNVTWTRHYLGTQSLMVLLIYDEGGQLVGIAPWYIRKKGGFFNLRDIRFLGEEEACSSYLDIIVSPGDRKKVIHRIYDYLKVEIRRSWDILTLSETPVESPSIDIWKDLIGEDGKVMDIVETSSCPVINLPESLERFLESLSGNERYNLNRKRKHLEEAGTVAYRRVSSVEGAGEAMETFVSLHEKRWTKKGSGGAFQSQRFLKFHLEIARLFAKKGWFQLDLLFLNGKAIAGIYGFQYHGRYSFYLPGLDPEALPKASPGIQLLFHRVEMSIREGLKQVDLLRGMTGYKMAWANGLRRSLTLRHYNRTLRSAVFKAAEGIRQTVKILVR